MIEEGIPQDTISNLSKKNHTTSQMKRSDTEDTIDNIKNINKVKRASLFENAEYEDSSTSVVSSRKPSTSPPSKPTTPTAEKIQLTHSTSDLPNARTNGKTKSSKKLSKLRYTRDGQLKSRFSDLKFSSGESIFEDEKIVNSDYFGFYILAWITIAVIFFDTLIHFQINHGSIWHSPIVRILKRDLWKVGLTDLAMYLSMYLTFAIQLAAKKKLIDWSRSGWIVQSVLEFSILFFYLWFSEYQNYPWVGKVFICLHSLVMLMKVHSYAFYNGYLWNITNELHRSKKYLAKHEKDGLDDETTDLLRESVRFCEFELEPRGGPPFPSNITVKNFFEYTMFPTVVYERSYPRTERIRWRYVLSKVCGIMGIITIMIIIAQNQIFPLYYRLIALRELDLVERLWNYPLLFIDLMPPFLALYLFVWYLIWELILNAIAELSMFADREFYGDWWNCVSWDEFARLWNVPVHKFLLRHVYHSSISAFRLSKLNATFFTFLLSSVIHELVMFVIFGKLRGYLLFLQMCQLPLVAISRSKFFKNRKVLGNVIFWLGIATGPSLMCSLYLTF